MLHNDEYAMTSSKRDVYGQPTIYTRRTEKKKIVIWNYYQRSYAHSKLGEPKGACSETQRGSLLLVVRVSGWIMKSKTHNESHLNTKQRDTLQQGLEHSM